MIFLWIPFLILLGVYLYYEKKNAFSTATLLKVLLSAFVAVVAVIAALRLRDVTGYLIALGLLCAVPADYFLQYIQSDVGRYRNGIFCFAGMHLCLLVGYYLRWPVRWHEFAIFALFLGVMLIFQKKERWNLGAVKIPLSIYSALVLFMAAKSISIAINDPGAATLLLGLGGLMFFVSDLFLGIWDYYKTKFVFLVCNRVIYFAGQLLFACALLKRGR